MSNDTNVKTFAMMGYPGAGKGSQSKFLSEELNFKIYSSGYGFREMAKKDTIAGHKVKEVIDEGYLMPHWIATHLFQRAALDLTHGEGIIFEGAARKESEARNFNTVMEWLERPYKVIFLNVSEEMAIERLYRRAESEGRAGDGREKFKVRFEQYNKHTAPAVEYFRTLGVVIDIDSEQTKKEVHKEIMENLKNLD